MATTQAALGRTLLDLSRSAPDAASWIVTVSPDVSSSTNLGGWVKKVGDWSTHGGTTGFGDDPETILHWRERPESQHIELGIAETNLVGLLGELGTTWSRWGQPLLPIGVLYDPFVERALEPWSFGIYAGGQSILVGSALRDPLPRRFTGPQPVGALPDGAAAAGHGGTRRHFDRFQEDELAVLVQHVCGHNPELLRWRPRLKPALRG